jgi:3-oxoacyl-[acyl-carrier protein] reductase
VVLVTGAARGLGQGIARELARDGDRIAFTYRNGGTPPDETLALVRPHDPDVVAVPSALDDEASAQALIDAVVAARGPIEVLVHAIGPIVVKRFARSSLADYEAMIDGNLRSAVALALAVLPGMRERRFGRIVFFGMNGSSVTHPARGLALYGAAKAGLVAFARALALEEAAAGISVNVVEPGDIRDKTPTARPRTQSRRKTRPDMPARGKTSRLPCASPSPTKNGFLNGMVIGVNGGLPEPHE